MGCGGMGFGAFRARMGIMELYLPGGSGHGKKKDGLSHAGTFNNHILTMVAGREALGFYTTEMVRVLDGLGERLRKGISGVLIETSVVNDKYMER
ncbi:hypothetical protein PAAG_06925 [Paracoccidioides lutzii Pb01]|uniref:Uncharacterized protein n=1 Tax=Paracoccidioides lutzii (strain ATCC MYA-826 / Pb01) TaxID=502779 RepID=C1H8C9_PARBA|nr:hypothetical protein PAAG_06925 [Paracoccidioides lutzii Pb01]EEH36507.2 hypothetical protein PAAG_06925 [Paracoccidioides lutzii Pb01]